MICSVDGCQRKAHAQSLCTKHYQRMRHHGSTAAPRCADGTPEERFWRFVDKRGPDECWPWTGVKSNAGRGRLKVNGKFVTAYRLSYEMHCGPIPDGMVVMHSCDNASCVNPRHLAAATQKQNLADRDAKGRRVTRRGDDSPIKKITDAQVEEIRLRNAKTAELAAKFGVSESLISMIRTGRRRTSPQIRGLS